MNRFAHWISFRELTAAQRSADLACSEKFGLTLEQKVHQSAAVLVAAVKADGDVTTARVMQTLKGDLQSTQIDLAMPDEQSACFFSPTADETLLLFLRPTTTPSSSGWTSVFRPVSASARLTNAVITTLAKSDANERASAQQIEANQHGKRQPVTPRTQVQYYVYCSRWDSQHFLSPKAKFICVQFIFNDPEKAIFVCVETCILRGTRLLN
jgi:hypothetical protein